MATSLTGPPAPDRAARFVPPSSHGVGGCSAAPAAAADYSDLDPIAAGGVDAASQ